MGITLQLVALLAFSNLALVSAQDTQYGACVTSCFTAHPHSSACNGDETGTALDQCTCASFSPSGDPLITCIQACPQDQQLPYAKHLPALCNTSLFPNLDLSSSSSASASSSQTASPSGSSNGATSTTSSTASTTNSATASATSGNGDVRIGASVRNFLPVAAGIIALNLV